MQSPPLAGKSIHLLNSLKPFENASVNKITYDSKSARIVGTFDLDQYTVSLIISPLAFTI